LRAPLLLLIDFQKAFTEIARDLARNNTDAEHHAARLLAHWRARRWPLLHVRHDSMDSHSRFRAGASGNAFMDFAVPQDNEPIIAKAVNSAFIGTDLAGRIDALGRPRIVMTGATTDHCVSTTARMAGNLGYDTVLVTDAMFTFDRVAHNGALIRAEDIHQAHLASLAGEFAALSTAEAILRANG